MKNDLKLTKYCVCMNKIDRRGGGVKNRSIGNYQFFGEIKWLKDNCQRNCTQSLLYLESDKSLSLIMIIILH